MKITTDNLDQTVTKAMKLFNVPGLTVATIENGTITKSLAFGIRDLNGTPMTSDTIFESASLTKCMFAVLYMKMVDKGLANLDIPCCSQEAPLWSDSPLFRFITPRQCLSHTSGLPNWADQPLPILFEPGARYSYSGEGYFLLQHSVENIMNRSWPEIMKEEFFAPYDMDCDVLFNKSMIKRFSVGFDSESRLRKERTDIDTDSQSYEPNAAWSLYANANEYAKFICELLNSHCGLSDDSFREMTSVAAKAGSHVSWGLGFGLTDDYLWHWGDNRGFKNFTAFDINKKNGIVIFTNSDNGMPCYIDILKKMTDLTHLDEIVDFINDAE